MLQLFWPEGKSEEKRRKRKQEKSTRGDQALSKAHSFNFKGSLYAPPIILYAQFYALNCA